MYELLTAQDVADRLQLKLSTIRNWTHIDYIPYIKLRAAVRYRWSDIEKWMEKRSAGGRLQRIVA